MARTVVYESTQDRGSDGAASKIAKYVPVELIAVASVFFSSFSLAGPCASSWPFAPRSMWRIYIP